jgi:LTXXQ motif family protein
MTNPAFKLRTRWKVCAAMGLAGLMLLDAPHPVDAQVVQGVEKGVREGNRAAGPVGGVLGGAIGGVVGVVTGVTGVLTGGNNNNNNASKGGQVPAAKDAKQGEGSKQGEASKQGEPSKQGEAAKPAKGSKATKTAKQQQPQQPAVLTQTSAPQMTAEQIVTNSDANIERIKKELNLTPEQEKHWAGFNSAMHYLGHNGADRLKLRVARAQRDPPDDIIEQMRNEAQFLNDRAVDQRNVADAAEPLFTSLDDKQRVVFIQEMVNLSHERGLD